MGIPTIEWVALQSCFLDSWVANFPLHWTDVNMVTFVVGALSCIHGQDTGKISYRATLEELGRMSNPPFHFMLKEDRGRAKVVNAIILVQQTYYEYA